MTTALIVIVVELAPLSEGPVHKDGIIERYAIAILDDSSRAAAFGVFDKPIYGLIPLHAGADQLAA